MKQHPSSKPPYSSVPPRNGPRESPKPIDHFFADFTSEEKQILTHYLSIEADQFTLNHLAEFRRQYGEQFDIVAAKVDELTQIYRCSLDAVRRALLKKLKEEKQEYHPSSPKEAVISSVPLNSQMSSRQFVSALTSEGKEILRELLLTEEDIRDTKVIETLEKQRGKKGYMKLAIHLIDRMISFPEAKKELSELLEGNTVETVDVFLNSLSPEDRIVLTAVLNMKDPDDPSEADRLIGQYARPEDEYVFLRISQHFEALVESLGKPAEEVKKLLGAGLTSGIHRKRSLLSRIMGTKKH